MMINATKSQGAGARVLIPALALLMLAAAGCSDKESTTSQEAAPAPETSEQTMAPETMAPETMAPAEAPEAAAGEPDAAAPAETQAAAVDGQQIYQSHCQVCHAAGVAGAPKTGDKDAWAPRIAKGTDALFTSVKNGLNAMPPKGACMSCSEEELHAAMLYLVEQGS